MSATASERGVIAVGFDGSEGSQRALKWAVGEAQTRGSALRIVRAWTPGEFGTDEEMGRIAAKSLESDITAILGPDPSVSYDAVTEQGSAAKILLHHAADAEMLVVGSRGHGGFTGLLLGSVGQQVATHAGAPVVVIVRR